MYRKIVMIAISLSFITLTLNDSSDNIFLSRATISTYIVALVILMLLMFKYNKLKKFIFRVPINVYIPVFMLNCFILTSFFSLDKLASFNEIIIIGFLISFAIVSIFLFKNKLLTNLFPIIIFTAFITSFIGIYDFIARNLNFYSLFGTSSKYAQSGFRNYGQAGHYIVVLLCILIPLWYSELKNLLPNFFKKLLPITIILAVVFLLFTGKIAAYIAFSIGIILFSIFNFSKSYKHLVILFLFSLLSYITIQGLNKEATDRIVYRIESRITNRQTGTIEADYLMDNFFRSIRAFKEQPFTGSGLGAFNPKYHFQEIHSTYLKMLGETGIIGLIGYIFFFISIISIFHKAILIKNNRYAIFLKLMIPFFIGLIIMWSYTFHLRKFEFWVLYVVIYICFIKFQKEEKVKIDLYEKKTH